MSRRLDRALIGALVLATFATGAQAAVAKRTASSPPATKSAPAPSAPAPKTALAQSAPASPAPKSPDKEVLKGGDEGTVFKNLTIEGENRIHIDFDRPAIEIDLDPAQAPGLEGGGARDQLMRTAPDLAAPLVALSSHETSPYAGRPWLDEFVSGPVARFRPNVEGVERWKLMVVDAKGQTVMTYSGNGKPPREIAWDGRSQSGAPVSPGLTYSYVFEAHDRAGNKRNFVGEGFEITAYRLDGPDGPTLLFTGRGLESRSLFGSPNFEQVGSLPPPILLEAASWLNQSDALARPIQVAVIARSNEQANVLAQAVARTLTPLIVGDPARIRTAAKVQPDAPEFGVVLVAAVK